MKETLSRIEAAKERVSRMSADFQKESAKADQHVKDVQLERHKMIKRFMSQKYK